MTRVSALIQTTALTTALTTTAAVPALADVTPADVWANTEAYIGAFGGRASGTLVNDGSVTRIEEFGATFALPLGLGVVEITASPLEMIANADGTVTFRYGAETAMRMSIEIPGQLSGDLAMQLNGPFDMIASGTPGDITYSYDVPRYSLSITEAGFEGAMLDSPEMAPMQDMALTGTMEVLGSIGTMQITEGDMMSMALDARYEAFAYDMRFSAGTVVEGAQRGTNQRTATRAALALPAGGVPVMALGQAVRNGMSIALEGSSGPSETIQEMEAVTGVSSSSRTTTQDVTFDFSVDDGGISAFADATGYSIEMTDAELPFELDAQAARLVFGMAVPVTGSDAQQPFLVRSVTEGLEFAEPIWSLFDPGLALPRDPATVRMEIEGEMGTSADLLDFGALMALDATGENPFSISAARLTDLYVSAVGAEISGTGDLTFDMSDMTTFEGIPAPSGVIDLSFVGVNGLIDTLIDMGILSTEDALGARMGLGMIARPSGEGEDALASKIEIDGTTGQVSANGQRLR